MPTLSVLCALCALLFSSCSNASQPPPASPPAQTAPPPAASAATSRVVGKIAAAGTENPPVIVLEPKTARAFPPQSEEPVMDQVSATFGPSLLFVRTGQPTEFRNSDDTLHNVHVTHEDSHEGQFNVAIPTGEHYVFTFKRDGFYHVGCDIHPSMSAEIFAAASPYVTTADGDGSFTFEDVEPGAYAITVYAGGKRFQKDVDIKNGVTNLVVE